MSSSQKLNLAPQTINLRVVLTKPTAGVDFGLQKGHGNNYEIVQKQRSNGKDLIFELPVSVKAGRDGEPDFTGRLPLLPYE